MDASNGYWAVQTFRPQAHTLAFFIMYGTGVASENEPRVYRTPGYVHLIYRCCQVEHSRTRLRVCHRWCLAWDCRLWSFCGYDIRGLCGGPLPNDLRLEPGGLALWNPPHMAADKRNFIVTMMNSGRRTYSGSQQAIERSSHLSLTESSRYPSKHKWIISKSILIRTRRFTKKRKTTKETKIVSLRKQRDCSRYLQIWKDHLQGLLQTDFTSLYRLTLIVSTSAWGVCPGLPTSSTKSTSNSIISSTRNSSSNSDSYNNNNTTTSILLPPLNDAVSDTIGRVPHGRASRGGSKHMQKIDENLDTEVIKRHSYIWTYN